MIKPVNQAGSLISISAAGALAATLLRDMDVSIGGYTLGTYDTILLAGGLLCLGAGLYAAAAFRTRASDRQPAEEQPAEAG